MRQFIFLYGYGECYLLGAGASFHALPVVEKFEEEIDTVIKHLIGKLGNPFDIAYRVDDDIRNALEYSLTDLDFLLKGCQDHSNVYTFARKFYLAKDNEQYLKVKRSIILFFELYYELFKKVDKRYDALLSSILNVEPPRLPNQIRIISWNYDYELERAYKNYLPPLSAIEDAYLEMNVTHKGGHQETKTSGFELIKLNGTIGYRHAIGEIKLGLRA